MGLVCCFTGHRRIDENDALRLSEDMDAILERVIAEGVTTFRAGGAMGFDNYAALKVIKLKKKYPFIRLHLFLPCLNQTRGWGEGEKEIYAYVLSLADEKTYTSEEYTRGCMHLRNRAMVDGSDFCIAYCKRDSGGTAYTVNYALKKGVTVLRVAEECE